MASTISEYLVKAASYNNASQGFLKKRTLKKAKNSKIEHLF